METTFQLADAADIARLVEMMRDFYLHEHLAFDEQASLAALHQILDDASLGRIYLMHAGVEVAGYFVLTFGFSLEYYGRDALVDELYVEPFRRGNGLGQSALHFIETLCRELDVKALHLQVARTNTKAQALYRRAGFLEHDRYLLTKRLK